MSCYSLLTSRVSFTTLAQNTLHLKKAQVLLLPPLTTHSLHAFQMMNGFVRSLRSLSLLSESSGTFKQRLHHIHKTTNFLVISFPFIYIHLVQSNPILSHPNSTPSRDEQRWYRGILAQQQKLSTVFLPTNSQHPFPNFQTNEDQKNGKNGNVP